MFGVVCKHGMTIDLAIDSDGIFSLSRQVRRYGAVEGANAADQLETNRETDQCGATGCSETVWGHLSSELEPTPPPPPPPPPPKPLLMGLCFE